MVDVKSQDLKILNARDIEAYARVVYGLFLIKDPMVNEMKVEDRWAALECLITLKTAPSRATEMLKQALLVCFSGYFHKVRRCKSHFTDPLLQNLIQTRQVTASGFLLDVIRGLTLNNAWRIIRSRQQHSVIEACRLADGSHYKKIPLWHPFLPS
jgi:hypothetical protein